MDTYTTSFIVFLEHCNHLREIIFGGFFMSQLDLAAAHCVRRALFDAKEGIEHAVTHKAEFEFFKPAYVGDLLELEAEIKSVGVKSLSVEVVAWRNKRRQRDKIAVGKFIFIAVGDVSDLSHHPELLPYKEHGLRMD